MGRSIIPPHDMTSGYIHNTNKFGQIVVIEYRGASEVLIRFVDTGYELVYNAHSIRKGEVKDRYAPTVHGVGYIGVGPYRSSRGRRMTPHYVKWASMLERCYCPKSLAKHPSYVGCSVDVTWHNFQNFSLWLDDQNVDLSESWDLDKDGSVANNKVYSPEFCQLISREENAMIAADTLNKSWVFENVETGEIRVVTNQPMFARELQTSTSFVNSAIRGCQYVKTCKGWKFIETLEG